MDVRSRTARTIASIAVALIFVSMLTHVSQAASSSGTTSSYSWWTWLYLNTYDNNITNTHNAYGARAMTVEAGYGVHDLKSATARDYLYKNGSLVKWSECNGWPTDQYNDEIILSTSYPDSCYDSGAPRPGTFKVKGTYAFQNTTAGFNLPTMWINDTFIP